MQVAGCSTYGQKETEHSSLSLTDEGLVFVPFPEYSYSLKISQRTKAGDLGSITARGVVSPFGHVKEDYKGELGSHVLCPL